ncbi:hypothetical protein HF521_019593 [Silurus meridionalis]|uniref:Uncharacterized protein n=1 Tax=Silurus meridionalis TaxID=175797 RepID=A0A8T0BH03_SILME|nr:hypothetical protein HF521_019593 [Silurus meridionalis]
MESKEINTAYISCIVMLNLIAWMLLVTAVGLGAIHYNECPIQPHIPIYLIVIGACGLILLMLAYWMNTLREGFWKQICILCVLCLSVFSIIWLITGSVWIYSINPPNFNSSAVEDFCQKSLYIMEHLSNQA